MKAMKWDQAGATPRVQLCLLNKDLDPGWYQLWRVVAMFRTQVSAYSTLAGWWKDFGLSLSADTRHGPFGKIIALLEESGLAIDAGFSLCFSERGTLSLVHSSEDILNEVLLRYCRRSICEDIVTRAGFEGLDGFDGELATSNDHVFSAAEVEQLMIVRDGSFFTNHAKHKWDSREPEICAWCHVKDTKQHRYTACVRYDDIRARYQELFDCWETLSPCFTSGGLVPQNLDVGSFEPDAVQSARFPIFPG